MDLHTLGQLQTEAVNVRTAHIDQIPTLDLCRIINAEDSQVASSITPFLPQIAEAIDGLASRVRRGGRVVYVGAGTSGRLGILDASEIPPTFAAPPSQFVGIIAGGDAAIRRAQEGAEDSVSQGEADLTALQLDAELDSVIGIAASGRTPYVLGCLAFAKRLGCLTIGVVCASPSAMSRSGDVDIMISPLPGPEVVTGSTRLKAGTATKLVLNMLSTGTMIRIGKTYGNQMVDLVASNEKLEQRSRNILRRLSRRCAELPDKELDAVLAQCQGSVKLALVVVETGKSVAQSRQDLESAGGILATVLEPSREPRSSLDTAARRLILCIDGGATKTAAVVVDETGTVVGRGRAGACNLTDGLPTDEAVRILISATQNALENASLAASLRRCFTRVWVGLAGIDRDRFREVLTPALCDSFGVSGTEMRLTNDVDLLAAAMEGHPEVSSAMVVIAGTGSVAMRYQRDVPGPTRLARSGGWGHLLGDEGGGYAIGLQAVRHTLTELEEMRLGVTSGPLGVLARMILERLGCEPGDHIDLVSELLLHRSQQSIKVRIASLAAGVLNLVGADAVATAVVEAQVAHLVDHTMARLLHPRSVGYAPPRATGLILSGSLFGHELYRKRVLDRVGGQFAYVEVVGDAASLAAHSLQARN